MGLDIRVPMGLMFGLLGIIIAIYGVASDPQIYAKHSLGVNINLWWGVAMIVFAVAMLGLAWRARKAGPPPAVAEHGERRPGGH